MNEITNLKGRKKIEAIEALRGDVSHIDTLIALIDSEKGEAKQTALTVLSEFESEKTIPIWQKLFKSANKGEMVLMPAISDTISEVIAPTIYDFFKKLFEKPDKYKLTDKEFRLFQKYFSLMVGKSSPAMLEIYRLLAENGDKFASFKLEATKKSIWVNDFIHFDDATAKNQQKILPMLLCASLVRSASPRLLDLSEELYQKYGKNWLTPRFLADLLTQKSEKVFENYAKMLQSEEKTYLFDAFGLLFFSRKELKHQAVTPWGDYSYGSIDTRTFFERNLCENLDERWLIALIEAESEPILLQIYWRGFGGVVYFAFDEMLGSILPSVLADNAIKTRMIAYFLDKEAQYNGQGSLYVDVLNQLGVPITEPMVQKWVKCPANVASQYSIIPFVNNLTRWSDAEKLQFYQKLPASLQNKDEIKRLL